MVIAAMKPGISSPSTLIERADLSMDTTLPVKLYRLAAESFASFVAGLYVSLPAAALARCACPVLCLEWMAHCSPPLLMLIMKVISKLGVNFARIVPVKASESHAVIKFYAAVGDIQPVQRNRIPFPEIFAHR